MPPLILSLAYSRAMPPLILPLAYSRAMPPLPNQKFIVGPSLISAFFYWDPFINDVDYRL